jgi:monoamine oxidase
VTSPAGLSRFADFVHPRSPFPRFEPDLLPRHAPPRRILVLGAGLAGLSAAYQLVRAGHDVVVLEARDRPGGRIETIRVPFQQGQTAEAGAMFVPGHHTLTIGYVGMLGLPLLEITEQATDLVLYLRGGRIGQPGSPKATWPAQVPLSSTEQQGGYFGLWASYVLPVATRALGNPRDPGWPGPALAGYDNQTFAEFLRQEGASAGAIEVLKLGYFDLFGDGIFAVSSLDILRDIALQTDGIPPQLRPGATVRRDFPPPVVERFRMGDGTLVDPAHVATRTYTIQGGNDRLPAALAATPELAPRISYGEEIARIEETGSGVKVTASSGRTWEGDRAIITIPFSVLREIELRGPVSGPKREAIDQLRATSVTRVFVQTGSRPWQAAGLPGCAATDLPIMYVNDQTNSQPGPAGILESYSAGPRARAWAAMPEAARHDEVIRQLELVYPGVAAAMVGTASKCWDQDRYARGDYCYFEPGEMRRLYPVLAGPEGRLHFAGEHTSALPGWMQGAFESGHRAAAEVHFAT